MSSGGKLAYHVWHRPIGAVRRLRAAGGPIEAWRTEAGRRAMESAARTLPLPPEVASARLEPHLLTGSRFWYQTAFCLWTLARQANRSIAPWIYDDGSLAPSTSEPLRRLFPAAQFVSAEETRARLEEELPASRFPTLRERWLNYPNIRKLTDPHLGGSGWKLVLDSDLLFFRRPDFLLRWLDHPDRPLHAIDCDNAYGYSRTVLNELAPCPVADRVNVGLCGLNSSELDWERLEFWCRTLIERERPHYYLEQALVAMLLADRECAVAPADDYVTLPRPPEADVCRAVMHHYVADSKTAYFRHNWRRAAAMPM